MKQKFEKSRRVQCGCIQIDTENCKACWKCIDACPNNVIGRINMPWHKHAKIVNRNNCIFCLKCVNACDFDAVLNLKKIEK